MIHWLIAAYAGAATILAAVFAKFWYRPPTENPTDPESEPVDPSVSPQEPPTAPITPKPMLDTFCQAIADFEGANPANNNPGNCRCSPVGYLAKYGHVTCNKNGFAVFPTKELGREYLENLVHQRAILHPNWTIYNFFANYAPSSDKNDPNHYAEFVAARCGVSPITTLAKLFR